MPYWEGKSVCDLFYGMAPEEFIRLDHKVITGGLIMHNFNVGHMVFDAQRILNMGLKGIKKEAEEELAKLNPGIYEDFEKSQFLKAAVIALDAVAGLAQRYAELAETMAKNESGSKRRAELKKIAQTCRRVPAGAARTFFEALQSIWFVHIGIVMEGWGTGIGIGRADQYLYPFYQKDMEEGRITKDDVLELFELLYIKMNSSVILLAEDAARIAGGFPIWPNMTLGGVTKDGEDAVNELSYLFLEAEAEVRLQQEEFIIRVNKKTPDAFLHKACEVAKLMRGKFKFVSDDTAIQALLDCGKPLPYARDYIVTGCFNLTVPGVSADLFSGMFNLPISFAC
jgi:formate C-acetyltransferase